MAGLMDGILNSLSAATTDMINHAQSIVNTDIYAYNEEFYEGYQWIACLDSRTCISCASLDNQIFETLPYMDRGDKYDKPGERAPEQPLHPGCRCIMVPVLEGMAEANQKGPHYEDWFERQKDDVKLDILGPSRYKAYKDGEIKITQFAKDGRVKTLDELKIDRTTRKELADELHGKNKEPKSDEVEISETKIEKEIDFDKTPLSETQLKEYNDYLMAQKITGVSEANQKKWADAIVEKVQKLPTKLQHIFYNNRTELTNNTEDGLKAYFDPNDLKIHMVKEYFKNTQTGMDKFFHEMGHAIDYKYGEPSAKINFRGDYNALIERAKALGKLNKNQLYKVLKGNKRGDISDMFAGLSNGRYKGDYWHDLSYYKTKGAIQSEGFAHIINSFQSDKRTEMKKFFPKAYEQFFSWLKDVPIDNTI